MAVLAPAVIAGLCACAILLVARLTPLPAWWDAAGPFTAGARTCSLQIVRDRTGSLLAVRRTDDVAFLPIRFDQVDPRLRAVTIAAEDRRFLAHPGVDLLAVTRAILQNLRAGHRVSGGSTLTQQLVKLRLDGVGGHRDLRAKLRESWWALVLEAHWSKERILEAYWNAAPYGANVRGVGAASWLYFGRDPGRLAPEEAALLAAIPRSPVRLDPRRDPEAARQARDRVLARLGLTGGDLASARERPIGLVPPEVRGARLAPHWLARVAATLPEAAQITLPLDPALQERAAAAVATALDALGERGADDAAAVVIHNPSGEVRAWVGSPDWNDPGHGQVDATRAPRQPGSALKPFAYALAFEEGLRPASLLPDLPIEYGSGEGNFRPRNYTGEYHGPVRARAALANSWNAAAVALVSGIGPERLRLLLQSAGISTLDQSGNTYGIGLALGDAEVTLIDLTAAYACLARGGVWKPRIEVLHAESAGGEPVLAPAMLAGSAAAIHADSVAATVATPAAATPADSAAATLADPAAATPADPAAPARILDERSAFFVTSILADPMARARAFGLDGPFSFPFPVAIKTGTSSDWRDNWAFGYTPEWTVGTWVGRAGGAGMDRVSGTAGAILALRDILLFLEDDRPDPSVDDAFPPPDGLETRQICTLSGMEAGPDCPETLDDWFETSDPSGPVCTWHRRFALDAASGLLARPCTPAGRVRRVLFTVPERTMAAAGSPVAWHPDAFLAWYADRGWPEPPVLATRCLCNDPACAPIDRPIRPARGIPAADLASIDPEAQARASGDGRDGISAGDASALQSAGLSRQGTSPARPAPACRILRPVQGTIYALDPSLPRSQQQVALEATAGADAVRWLVDGREVGTAEPGERIFWPLTAGSHRIRAEAGPSASAADEIRIVVEGPP